MKSISDRIIAAYKSGLEEGKREALIELQKDNPNKDLPSNEVLFKIFKLLFECQERQRNSLYFNQYEVYANYITKNWKKNEK